MTHPICFAMAVAIGQSSRLLLTLFQVEALWSKHTESELIQPTSTLEHDRTCVYNINLVISGCGQRLAVTVCKRHWQSFATWFAISTPWYRSWRMSRQVLKEWAEMAAAKVFLGTNRSVSTMSLQDSATGMLTIPHNFIWLLHLPCDSSFQF